MTGRSWKFSLNALAEKRPRTVLAITFLVAAIPACFALSWVLRYGVEVPTKDDWAMAPIIVKAQTGHLKFADLFEQQQEARTILPKLIFVAFAATGHWNVREQMILSVIICGLTAAGIYRLLSRTGLPPMTVTLCFWLISLAIFSAAQFELWIWASGFPSFMPALFLVVALLALETPWTTRVKFAVCALCATASSFTLPHGLLLWGLTFPLLLVRERIPHWPRWLGAWTLATIICAVAYFQGYARPFYHPEFAPARPLPHYLHYFFAFIGGEFAFAAKIHRLALATWAGSFLPVLYAGALGYAFWRRRDAFFWSRLLPWFALGAYAIGSGCLATLGRIGFGLDSAYPSRYVPFSLYLTVAVVVLLALIGQELRASGRSPGFALVFAACCLILCGAFVTLGAFASVNCLPQMEKTSAQTRLLRGAVLYSQVLNTSGAMGRTSHLPPKFIQQNAADLDGLNLLRPPLIRSAELGPFQAPNDDRSVAGKCEAITPLDDDHFRATGFAALTTKGRPADAVILAYETSDQRWVAFAFSDDVIKRRDIARRFRHQHQLWSGWSVTFPGDAVPNGAKIGAWALDAEIPSLYRLE